MRAISMPSWRIERVNRETVREHARPILVGICLVAANLMALLYDADVMKTVIGLDAGLALAYFSVAGDS